MIQHYELLAIFPATKSEEEIKPDIDKLRSLLTEHGATVVREDFWGKRKLAYEIRHINHGYYHLVDFDVESSNLPALDRVLQLYDGLLRHQIVVKIVKGAEELAAEVALRERIAARRQVVKEQEAAAEFTPTPEPAPEQEPAPAAPVPTQKLDEKLKELLGSDTLDI